MADILDLFGDDPAAAQMQARALADAMRRRKAAGTVATIIGGPFQGAGRAFLGDADQTAGTLAQAGQYRAQAGLQGRRMAQDESQFEAQQAGQRAASASAERRHAEDLKMRREAMDQEAWAAVPDQLGGVVMYNRKTGESRPMGPQGPGQPGAPRMPAFKTEGQSNAYGFAGRIRQARKDMEEAGYPSGAQGYVDASAMGARSGPVSSLIPQEAASEPGSRYYTAARNLAAALLRKESGAAIGKDEWAFAMSNYIPTQSDSPELRANKLKMLDIMENAMVASAGPSGAQALDAPPAAEPAAAPAPALSPQDAEAKAWAEANPTDPRAAAILQRLGGGR